MDDALLSLLLNGNPAQTGIALSNVGYLNLGIYLEASINGDDPNIAGTTMNIFDNMYFGIQAENSNFTSTNNAFQYLIAALPNSNANGYGIEARNTSGGTAEYQMKVTGVNKFYDCTFGVAATGYNDITVNGTDMRSTQMPVSNLPLEGNIGVYAATPFCNTVNINENVITNVRNGIVFFGDADVTGTEQIIGDVTIDGNTIQATLSGNSDDANNEYVNYGIFAANIINYTPNPTSGLTGPIQITNNNIYQVHNGIYMQGWKIFEYQQGYGFFNRAYTSDNYVTLRKVKYPDSNNYPQFGIMHTLNWSPVVTCNIIDGFNDNSDVQWQAINMYYNFGYQYDVVVSCNQETETGSGIRFVGEHGNTLFENNEMDNNQWGYVLESASIGQQGNATYGCGNTWTGFTTGNYKTYTWNLNSNTLPTYSILYLISQDMPSSNENNTNGPYNHKYDLNNGFLYAQNNNQNDCDCGGLKQSIGNMYAAMAPDTSMINWLEKISLDSIQYAIFDTEQRISARHRLYRLLMTDPSLLTKSAVLKNFHIASQNSNMALLAQTESQITSGAFSNALSVSNALTPANNIEQNYADFYKAYLNYKKDSIAINDSITLSNLANGCVPRDGIVVLQARALYSLIYNDFTTRIDDCNVNNSSKSNPQTVILSESTIERFFNLYPNPNIGYMTLDYILKDNEKGLFTIYDISGRKISSYGLISGQNSLVINEPSIKNGIYYYNVFVNNELIKTNRIVIIK